MYKRQLCNSVVFARGNENGNIIQPTQNREYQVKPDADPKEADGGIEDEENNVVQPSVNTQNDVLLLNDAVKMCIRDSTWVKK